MAPKISQSMLAGWFDRLVKNKMASVAVCVSGIAISCFLLTFAKLFTDVIFQCVSFIALAILAVSSALFIYAIVRQVFASDYGAAPRPPKRDEGVSRRVGGRNAPQISSSQTGLPTEVEIARLDQSNQKPDPLILS
jgi:hypothetical protein